MRRAAGRVSFVTARFHSYRSAAIKQTSVRKKGITVLLVCATILVALIWVARVPEPSHKGVPLGELLDKNGARPGGLGEAREAVRALGARAVPYLVHVLEREPTPLQQRYARAHPRFPASLRKLAPQPKNFNQRRARTAAVLTEVGTNAVAAIPVLLKAARDDPFFGTRHNAVGTLASIAPGTAWAEEAASVVIDRTSDPNEQLRQHAFSCLGAFTNQMPKVVPILLHGLRNPAVGDSALQGLRRLGTNAMRVARERVQNEGYLPMSLEELERKLGTP
jgi:hypothetical protein